MGLRWRFGHYDIRQRLFHGKPGNGIDERAGLTRHVLGIHSRTLGHDRVLLRLAFQLRNRPIYLVNADTLVGEQSGVSMGLVSRLADPQLARALTAMHERPQTSWSLESLAGLAAMSRSAFANCFKKVVGVTPAEYLTDWRMALAKKQLGQGRAVKLIAPELGYANASALSRVFAQRTGISPRGWLARSHENRH